MIVLTIITLGLVCFFYSIKCLNAPISSTVRCSLAAFRLLFIIFVLFLLTLPQVLEIIKITSSTLLYIVLDDSLSMGFPSEPPSSSAAMGPSRWDTMVRHLREEGIIDSWERKGFQLRYLPLSKAMAPQAGVEFSWMSRFPQSATPTGSQTNLSAAIDCFSETISSRESAYLLLFTDGQWNQGRNPIAAAAQLASTTQSNHPPIYTFGVGTATPVRDVIIDNVQLPAIARSGETIQLKAHLLVRGIEAGTSIPLIARGENSNGDQVFEQEHTLSVIADSDELSASFDLPKLEKGQYIFSVRAEVLNGEWIDSNNRFSRGLQIRDAKDGVLLLTSAPDWEFRFLKRTLEDQKNLDVQAYYHHENGVNPLGDRDWINRHSTQSTTVQEEKKVYRNLEELLPDLNQWPVIILHNFSFTIEQVDFVRRLKEYIENGGGLIFIPGSNNAGNLPQAIRDAIPPPLDNSFSPSARAVITQAVTDANEPFSNLSKDLPGMDLPPLGDQITPRTRSDAGKVLLQGMAAMNETVPLVTLFRYGLGRIVILGSQSFWRWNILTGRDVLTPFWVTALYQGCPRMQTKSGEIQTDGYLFNVYDKVRITWRMGERIGEATESSVALTVQSPSRKETVWLAPAGDAPGIFETRYTPPEPGMYQIANRTQDASAEFRVENTAAEFHDLRQNIQDLTELARLTGGEYANQPAWKALANRLPVDSHVIRENRVRFLGEKWWMATLLILLLGLEWFLRWKKGLP